MSSGQSDGHGDGHGGRQQPLDMAEALGERVGQAFGTLYNTVRGFSPQPRDEAEQPSAAAATERAEHLVNDAQRKITLYGAFAWYGMRRIAARAKEEYQDIAAEAQVMRQAAQQATREEQERDASGQ